MSKSILEYQKDYKRYQYMGKASLGAFLGCATSRNYFGAVWFLIAGIANEILARSTYKNSAYSTEYQILNATYDIVKEQLIENIKTLELQDIEGVFAYLCYICQNNYLSYDRNPSIIHDTNYI